MTLRVLFRLMRAEQWYKNLIVFLALFFTNNVFRWVLLERSLLAFASLCFLSSSYYILNDIWDLESDRRHPEKKRRPIAAGIVSVKLALALCVLMFILSFVVASFLKTDFVLIMLLLYVLNLSYTLFFRNLALVDLHVIAVNFLLRAVAGAVVIGVPASPWLVTVVFFTALLLGVGKRRGELILLGDEAVKFKPVYRVYTKPLLDMLLVVISTTLLLAYILYTFFVHQGGYMMVTIPFATFVLFRYLYLASVEDKAARKAHRLLLDWQTLTALALWCLVLFYLLYVMRI